MSNERRPNLKPATMQALREDPRMYVCLMEAAGTTELVEQFDRLNGTNLSRKGAPIVLMVDEATGRLHSDMDQFIEFVHDYVYLPMVAQGWLADEATAALAAMKKEQGE